MSAAVISLEARAGALRAQREAALGRQRPAIDDVTLAYGQRSWLDDLEAANPPRQSTLIMMLALAEDDREREAIVRELEARR